MLALPIIIYIRFLVVVENAYFLVVGGPSKNFDVAHVKLLTLM